VVFEPNGRNDPTVGPIVRWVAPHAETTLWSASGKKGQEIGIAHQWAPLQVVGKSADGRLPIWDPSTRNKGWVRAQDVGPVDPTLVGTAYLPPIGRPVAWGGPARVTMYTCVELGGCAATASGIWPEAGMVAVDPTVIPLGSTVWIQGLGTFLAADTGSLVRGAHLDVFGHSYTEAIQWGVQERAVLVFAPQ
jgi:3D (Asp-Asp-Asp) domain-containing protein